MPWAGASFPFHKFSLLYFIFASIPVSNDGVGIFFFLNSELSIVISAAAPKKSLKFKTTTDASEAQVIEAMQKISSHIKNPAKFSKAAKLAIQLIQAGSVKSEISDYFFAILEAAMSSSITCTDPSVRADYHSLFSVAQNTKEVRLTTCSRYS